MTPFVNQVAPMTPSLGVLNSTEPDVFNLRKTRVLLT